MLSTMTLLLRYSAQDPKSLTSLCHYTQVTRQLSQRFFPQPQFIKKSIESLLEREYLERDANDAKMYTYLA